MKAPSLKIDEYVDADTIDSNGLLKASASADAKAMHASYNKFCDFKNGFDGHKAQINLSFSGDILGDKFGEQCKSLETYSNDLERSVNVKIGVFVATQALFKPLVQSTNRSDMCALALKTITSSLRIELPPKLAIALYSNIKKPDE
jgi:hypothetical protein